MEKEYEATPEESTTEPEPSELVLQKETDDRVATEDAKHETLEENIEHRKETPTQDMMTLPWLRLTKPSLTFRYDLQFIISHPS